MLSVGHVDRGTVLTNRAAVKSREKAKKGCLPVQVRQDKPKCETRA